MSLYLMRGHVEFKNVKVKQVAGSTLLTSYRSHSFC